MQVVRESSQDHRTSYRRFLPRFRRVKRTMRHLVLTFLNFSTPDISANSRLEENPELLGMFGRSSVEVREQAIPPHLVQALRAGLKALMFVEILLQDLLCRERLLRLSKWLEFPLVVPCCLYAVQVILFREGRSG